MATDYLDHLRKVPLFSHLKDKELETISKGSTEIKVHAGKKIADQGSLGQEAFLILSGEVEVERNGTKIAELSAGQVAGELALLDHGLRTASLVCKTDCDVLVVDSRHFRGILEGSPALMMQLLEYLAGRIRALDEIAYP